MKKSEEIKNEKIIKTPKDLNLLRERLQESIKDKKIISICSGTGCKAYSSDEIYNLMQEKMKKLEQNNPEKVKNILLKRTGCHGFCEKGPIIVIYPEGICYVKSKVEDAEEILEKTIEGKIVDRLLYKDDNGNPIVREQDIPFYKFQKRILLDINSKIDPASIDDYIRVGGYRALAKVSWYSCSSFESYTMPPPTDNHRRFSFLITVLIAMLKSIVWFGSIVPITPV
mgnify:CR=1 FL=1